MKLSNQNKIVVGVIALILALTVGYAIFSETLNIGGTASASGEFSLIFNTVGEIKEVGSHGTTVTGEKTKALDIRNITLEYPSSYVEIPATIKNAGTIDAKLKDIKIKNRTKDETVANDLTNGDITVTHSGVAIGERINVGKEKDMKITVTWNRGSENKISNLEFDVELVYEQVTGESSEGGSNPGGIVFPKVSGKLGDNVNFYYDNGVIDITGFGPMSEGTSHCIGDHTYCNLGDEITLKIAETITTGSEKADYFLYYSLGAIITGNRYEDMGVTKEELEMMLTMPEEEGGMGVTREEAKRVIAIFDAVPKLKSISIAEGITSIRGGLFETVNIDTLTISNSITSITSVSRNTLFSSSTINKLYLGTGLNPLPENLISHSTINNIIIPEGITKIETRSISEASNLESLTIPSTVTEISASAISGNPDLETIVNKTGRSFDWNLIIKGTSGEAFETGTVECNGKTITIIK